MTEVEQEEEIQPGEVVHTLFIKDKESGTQWVKVAKASASKVVGYIKRIEGWNDAPDDLKRELIRAAAAYLARNI